MSLRREYVFLWTAVLASLGFSYRTTNFVVEAPTQEIAQTIGQAAEHYRREKAMQWIDRKSVV